MTPYQRQRQREKCLRLYRRWQSHGWVVQQTWIPKQVREQINARAAQLGMTKHIVATAALVTGLRTMTTSDILREQQRWREKIKPASATQFQKGRTVYPRDPLTGHILRYANRSLSP